METISKSPCLPTYHVLTQDQIKHIHCATLELLETVGVKVMVPQAIDLLSGASAPVTLAGAIVVGNAEALSGIVLHQQLVTRMTLEPWIAAGRPTWGKQAVEKAQDILKNHHPPARPDPVQQSLNQLRQSARQELADEHIGA